MSRYRRAPLCRFCWTRGHTSLNCPDAKARAEAAKAGGAISYKDEEAIELVAKRKHVAENRTCSYCSEHGHNVRGCEQRAKDIDDCIVRLIEWRKKFVDAVVEAGYGIGAIVTHNGYSAAYGYPQKGQVYTCMIAKITNEYHTYWSFSPFHFNGFFGHLLEKLHDYSYTSGYYVERPWIPAALVRAMCDEVRIARWEQRSDKYITTIVSPSHANPFDSSFASYDTCKNLVEGVFNGDNKKKPSRNDIISARLLNQ